MALSDSLEQFSKLPNQHKVAGFVVVSALVGVVFYFLFYSSVLDEKQKLTLKIQQLSDEKDELEGKKRQYMALRNRVMKMMERQKELMKILPAESEIHTLLRSIHAQAELAGLNIVTFEQSPEVYEKYYAKIPVKLKIEGTFHQITKFFHAVGQLKRIVNIQNLTLDQPKVGDQGIKLRATLLASTFRFLKPGDKKKKKKGRGGHGGGGHG